MIVADGELDGIKNRNTEIASSVFRKCISGNSTYRRVHERLAYRTNSLARGQFHFAKPSLINGSDCIRERDGESLT